MTELTQKLTPEFRDFLVEAKQNGYGSPNKSNAAKTGSGMTRIDYRKSPFWYVDNYVGGNPYAGFEHVSAETRSNAVVPIWAMSYYETFLHPEFSGESLFAVLRKVLAAPKSEVPIRGPELWEEEDTTYVLSVHGVLENFDAEEWISRSIGKTRRVVYSAKFIGGLVNASIGSKDPFWLEVKDEK